MDYKNIKTSKKMNESVKEQLSFRDDHLSKYAVKRIEELEQLILSGVEKWVMIKDEPPPILETVWLSNGKGWTNLGCRVETNEGWHWAVIDGIIYQEKDQIVAECYSDDLDVVYWCKLPKTPCA